MRDFNIYTHHRRFIACNGKNSKKKKKNKIGPNLDCGGGGAIPWRIRERTRISCAQSVSVGRGHTDIVSSRWRGRTTSAPPRSFREASGSDDITSARRRLAAYQSWRHTIIIYIYTGRRRCGRRRTSSSRAFLVTYITLLLLLLFFSAVFFSSIIISFFRPVSRFLVVRRDTVSRRFGTRFHRSACARSKALLQADK